MDKTRRPRLLYVLESLEVTSLNGHVGALLEYFLEKGTEVTLLTVHMPQTFRSHNLLERVELRSVRSPWHLVLYVLTHVTTYDTVFTYNFSRINFLLWFLKRLLGKGYWIKTDCLVTVPRGSYSIRECLSDWVNITLFFRGADLVLVETPALVYGIQQAALNSKVVLFPNSIDTNKLARRVEQLQLAVPIPKSRYTVLYTGRLVRLKGLEIMIRAFGKLAHLFAEWDVRIVGPIKDESYFKSLTKEVAKHFLSERIQFIPPKYGDDLLKEYSTADIFCIPSLPGGDGMPMSLIEAMSWGIPVIASAHPAVRYVLDDGQAGIVFPPGNENELAAALAQCMGSAALRQVLGKAGQDRVESYFDLRDAFQRLEQTYSGIMP